MSRETTITPEFSQANHERVCAMDDAFAIFDRDHYAAGYMGNSLDAEVTGRPAYLNVYQTAFRAMPADFS